MNEQQRERFYRLQNIRLERELDEMEAEERMETVAGFHVAPSCGKTTSPNVRPVTICYVKPEIMTIEEMRIVFLTYKEVRLHPESTLA